MSRGQEVSFDRAARLAGTEGLLARPPAVVVLDWMVTEPSTVPPQ